MNNAKPSLNDIAWEKLFKKYNILHAIDSQGYFEISATQIKEFREPRLMAKFDHTINLPRIFQNNKLAILPITRGKYIISRFKAYHKFEADDNMPITQASLPSYIQSLDCNNIPSEAVALNCAVAAGIMKDFLDDDEIIPTVSGRMGSGVFDFNIASLNIPNNVHSITVNNSQIEIDAAYEGRKSLALIEAKRDLSEDFLIRQLYYPYRVWQDRVTKTVRPIFLVYSNGIYRLYEYQFVDPNNYSSLQLIKQKNYSIEDTTISITDIQDVLNKSSIIKEPKISFPQADSFERIINICELLNEQELSRNDVTENYAFDGRQTNYYTDAARYLGLVKKRTENYTPIYKLTNQGKQILNLSFKHRQLAYCSLILSHEVFAKILKTYLNTGIMPTKNNIIRIMKDCNLYSMKSNSTFDRRSSTIKSWINWIISLVND